MAKKQEKKTEKHEESSVVVPIINIEETSTPEVKDVDLLDKMTIFDLLNYEKAASLLCRKYENGIKQYDGTIRQNSFEYEKFRKMNDLHNKIINAIEKNITNLL